MQIYQETKNRLSISVDEVEIAGKVRFTLCLYAWNNALESYFTVGTDTIMPRNTMFPEAVRAGIALLDATAEEWIAAQAAGTID